MVLKSTVPQGDGGGHREVVGKGGVHTTHYLFTIAVIPLAAAITKTNLREMKGKGEQILPDFGTWAALWSANYTTDVRYGNDLAPQHRPPPKYCK